MDRVLCRIELRSGMIGDEPPHEEYSDESEIESGLAQFLTGALFTGQEVAPGQFSPSVCLVFHHAEVLGQCEKHTRVLTSVAAVLELADSLKARLDEWGIDRFGRKVV